MKKVLRPIKRLFMFSDRAKTGILVLLPLLAVAGIFVHGVSRIKPDRNLQEAADSIIAVGKEEAVSAGRLFFFDPNTVTLEQLCELGFELRVAASILKYRNAGKRFTVPEDLAMCYGVTLEKYRELEPYIVIGQNAAAAVPRKDATPGPIPAEATHRITAPAAPFDPNVLGLEGLTGLGFTDAQAHTIMKYREACGGFTSVEHFGKCYAVSPEALDILGPFLIFRPADTAAAPTGVSPSEAVPAADGPIPPKIEINSADSAALRSISGIGEVLVVRIMEYRDRLGGFVRADQLAEIKGMSEVNYERICGQIIVDSCKISGIDINFAPHKQLAARLGEHPYATPKMIRKLLSERQMKGGWSNTGELVEQKIWTEEEAARMAPYLVFLTSEQ